MFASPLINHIIPKYTSYSTFNILSTETPVPDPFNFPVPFKVLLIKKNEVLTFPSWQTCIHMVPTRSHSNNTFGKTQNSFCSYCLARKFAFFYFCSQAVKILSKNVIKPE